MNELPNAECINAVPVRLERIFDSCSDKDCITDLQVTLDDCIELPPQYTSVKTRSISIDDICMSVEPIPFNRGYFTVDMTYTFGVELLCCTRNGEPPAVMRGVASASKSVILYGSESNTKTFFSSGTMNANTNCGCDTANLPTVSCRCVDPIALETRICVLPQPAQEQLQSSAAAPRRTIVLTLGVFSVVELSRPVTMTVAAYPYQVPTKSCSGETDTPCEVFSRLNFPTEEFAPAEDGCAPQQSAEKLRCEGFSGIQMPMQ